MHFNKHIKDNNTKLITELQIALPKVEIENNFQQVTLNILAENLLATIQELKENKDLQFLQLVDVTAVDYPNREKRFDVLYMLLSHRKNERVIVKVAIADGEKLPTMVDFYPSANWSEREVYDMFGIEFINHPNLKRILTDYGFQGHPLRKDFPLNGTQDLFYDEEAQACVYKDVELAEPTRFYDNQNKWTQLNDNFDLAEFDKPNKEN